jgi:uncharacterized protein YndB with AHSA1/START domain
MSDKNLTITLTVDKPANEVFNLINNVTRWWTEDLTGNSHKLNDEFTVRFGDVHVSTQKLVEIIPNKKVVWLVTHSSLNFIADKHEWTNTTICFELSGSGNKTQVVFTHIGLVPEVECFEGCRQGWDHYINGSLLNLLTKGKDAPGLKENIPQL